MQKLNSRKAALVKTKSVPDTEKAALQKSLDTALMSSEDSDEDGTFIVRPLSWRSKKAADFYHSLDTKFEKRQSIRSRLMTFQRQEGMVSDRLPPPPGSVPTWCLK